MIQPINYNLNREPEKSSKGEELETLFLEYSPRLINYAARFVDDRPTAEDIVQECFANLWEKRERFELKNTPTLLFTMVRNCCLDVLRHKVIVDAHTMRCKNKIKGEERLYNYDFHFESETPLLCDELERQIQKVISSLPSRCREVFLLSRFDGLRNREISEKLGISQTAVEKHISRALNAFTAYFKHIYPFHSAS